MTQQEETRIRLAAKVEEVDGEYVATYGDYSGHGDTTQQALDLLIIDLQYAEASWL